MPKTTKIDTVNIIEASEGCVLGITSFKETKEGNKEAEELFRKIIIENVPVEDIEAALDNGYYEDGTYTIYIVHSD